MTATDLALLAATVTSGLLAGVYAFYAHTVVPAVAGLGDPDFVTAFQALDRRIVNPWFMAGSFLGAPVLTALALALAWGGPATAWVATALGLHLVATAVTGAVHVPRNDALKAFEDTGDAGASHVARQAFDEGRWARWNLVRVVVSVAATTCLAWGLTLAT